MTVVLHVCLSRYVTHVTILHLLSWKCTVSEGSICILMRPYDLGLV